MITCIFSCHLYINILFLISYFEDECCSQSLLHRSMHLTSVFFCFKENPLSRVKKFLSSQVRTANIDNQGSSRRTDDKTQEEEAGDLDFANFMTLDSVGEDGEEINKWPFVISYSC